MISTDLFSFAYIPAWYEQLYELSQLAAPETWRFKQPDYETQNDQTPILERYINQVFRKQAVEYNYAQSEEADPVFYIRNEFSCFHTGLYTPGLKAIYGFPSPLMTRNSVFIYPSKLPTFTLVHSPSAGPFTMTRTPL